MIGDDLQAIRAVMQRYFDGLHHSDVEALGSVLHPKALYACPTDSLLVHETRSSYLEIVARRESPASRNESRADAIEAIQLAGPNAAFVRARCRIADRHFTDLLTLVRDGGEWRILSKVFHYDPWTEKEAPRCRT